MAAQPTPPNPARMPMYELLHQLMALSDDPQTAGRFIVLDGDGSYVGEVTLADRDVSALNDTLASLLAAKEATEESTRPVPLDDDPKAIEVGVAELEAWANNDGGAPRQRDGE